MDFNKQCYQCFYYYQYKDGKKFCLKEEKYLKDFNTFDCIDYKFDKNNLFINEYWGNINVNFR